MHQQQNCGGAVDLDRVLSGPAKAEATSFLIDPTALPRAYGADDGASIGEILNRLAEGFSEQVAIVDEDWTILAVNDAWRQMISVAGYPELMPGINYRDFLETFVAAGHRNAAAVFKGLKAIEAGATNRFELTYEGADEWEGRTLQLRINRLFMEGRNLATIARQDVTDSTELGRLREQFSSSVLECQAAERRRFGRELHDSTAQLLTSAGLLLFTLKGKSLSTDSLQVVDELQELLREVRQEVRSIAYLSHPPALDGLSLADALKTLVNDYARRTGLKASFQRRGRPNCLSHVAESALYRTAQEALANVVRHARAEHVRVSLNFTKAAAHLILIDDGIGISRRTLEGRGQSGVGLAGMRSRLAEIGGRLSVRRLKRGTAICASVPVRSDRRKAA